MARNDILESHLQKIAALDEAWIAAVRKDDTREANKIINEMGAVFSALEKAYGRSQVEDLLVSTSPSLRLRAAQEVFEWEPDLAVPVLGRLLVDELSSEPSPDVRLEIRTCAKDYLYMHFNIRSFDRNDLIEPLRRYGVQLPIWVRSE